MIGQFGLLASTVVERRYEVAVRVAVGAGRAGTVWLVVRRGLGQSLAGISVGALAAIATARTLESQLYGIGSFDSVTFGLVAAFVMAASFIATIVPAWRVARIDPILVLR